MRDTPGIPTQIPLQGVCYSRLRREKFQTTNLKSQHPIKPGSSNKNRDFLDPAVSVSGDHFMSENKHDLKKRTFQFARSVRQLGREITPSISNRAALYQLIKSSGSVGANYLEANNALSRKDFLMRARICLKEAKESGYWLQLLYLNKTGFEAQQERDRLLQESVELVKIFATIIRNGMQT